MTSKKGSYSKVSSASSRKKKKSSTTQTAKKKQVIINGVNMTYATSLSPNSYAHIMKSVIIGKIFELMSTAKLSHIFGVDINIGGQESNSIYMDIVIIPISKNELTHTDKIRLDSIIFNVLNPFADYIDTPRADGTILEAPFHANFGNKKFERARYVWNFSLWKNR